MKLRVTKKHHVHLKEKLESVQLEQASRMIEHEMLDPAQAAQMREDEAVMTRHIQVVEDHK